MRTPTVIFTVIALGFSSFPSTCAARPPNVLFISLDDMNDWLGCYRGHPDAKTPCIDRLAERGMMFTNAYCVSPICGPSRSAVLTGMRPETTGVYHNRGTYIDYVPDAVTFPEHFRANGYRTMAAGKVNHDLGQPDPKLWDENGPDCGVLGTPFIGDELHTAKMTPERIIDRGSLQITLPANGGGYRSAGQHLGLVRLGAAGLSGNRLSGSKNRGLGRRTTRQAARQAAADRSGFL